MGQPFKVFPSWLIKAFGLQEPTLPNKLDAEQVTPVVDVHQGGWSAMQYLLSVDTIPASTAASDPGIVGGQFDKAEIVFALGVARVGGAAAATVKAFMVDNVRNIAIEHFETQMSVGSEAGTADWHGVSVAGTISGAIQFPMVIPQGFTLRLSFPATGVGETYTWRVLRGIVPAGSKPL